MLISESVSFMLPLFLAAATGFGVGCLGGGCGFVNVV